jgi:hypothetical protein
MKQDQSQDRKKKAIKNSFQFNLFSVGYRAESTANNRNYKKHLVYTTVKLFKM